MMQDNNERAREVVAEKPFSVIVIINEEEWKEGTGGRGEESIASSAQVFLSFSQGPNSNDKKIGLKNCFSFFLRFLAQRKS